jgi:hypothetical protein
MTADTLAPEPSALLAAFGVPSVPDPPVPGFGYAVTHFSVKCVPGDVVLPPSPHNEGVRNAAELAEAVAVNLGKYVRVFAHAEHPTQVLAPRRVCLWDWRARQWGAWRNG